METERALEVALSGLTYFSTLRADEIVRVASAFRQLELRAGDELCILAGDAIEMVLVVEGSLELQLPARRTGEPPEQRRMYTGDRFGDLSLETQELRPVTLKAHRRGAVVALLSADGIRRIFDEFPVVALPLCEEIAGELKWKNDLLRDLQIIHAEGLADEERRAALADRRRKLKSGRRGVIRAASSMLWRRLISERDKEPAFWVLFGFLVALGTARTVVKTILTFNLQKKLFALIPSAGGLNPIHVHHFNYGIMLVVLVGVLALVPTTRRFLRFLGFTFGVGLGLIVDEFALLWHLDPDYYQRASYVAMLVAALLLTQLIYFRDLYLGLLRRASQRVRAWRR